MIKVQKSDMTPERLAEGAKKLKARIKAELKAGARLPSEQELAYLRSPKAAEDVEREYADELLPKRRGRPKAGEKREPAVTKTVKAPKLFWVKLEKKAEAHGLTVHEAMRKALVEWMQRAS